MQHHLKAWYVMSLPLVRDEDLPPSAIIAVDDPGVSRDLAIEPAAAMPVRGAPSALITSSNRTVAFK